MKAGSSLYIPKPGERVSASYGFLRKTGFASFVLSCLLTGGLSAAWGRNALDREKRAGLQARDRAPFQPGWRPSDSVLRKAAALYASSRLRKAVEILDPFLPRKDSARTELLTIRPEVVYLAARILSRMGRWSRAAEMLQRFLSVHKALGPSGPPPLLSVDQKAFMPDLTMSLARLRFEQKLYRKAAWLLWALRKRRGHPLWWEALSLQADCFFRSGRYDAAFSTFKEMISLARTADLRGLFRLRAAEALGRMGKLKQEAVMLRRTVVTDAGSLWDHKVLARLDSLREKLGEGSVPKLTFKERRRRAQGLQARFRNVEAARVYSELAPAMKPSTDGWVEIHLEWARSLILSNRLSEAIPILDGVRRSMKTPPPKLFALLDSAWRRMGRYDLVLGRLCRLRGSKGCSAKIASRAKGHNRFFEALLRIHLSAGLYMEGYELSRGSKHRSSRVEFLSGFLAFKSGRFDEAARSFRTLLGSGDHREAAAYWLGRTLSSSDPASGKTLLERLSARKPMHYYGLLARARLLEDQRGSMARPHPLLWYRNIRRPPLALAKEMRRIGLLNRTACGESLLRLAAWLRMGMMEEGRRELRWILTCFLPRSEAIRKKRRPLSHIEAQVTVPCGGSARSMELFSGKQGSIRSLLRNAAQWLDDTSVALRLGGDGRRLRFATPMEPWVRELSRLHGVRPSWIWAVMKVESAFDPLVISWAGASGLMQIMPHTARRIASVLDGKPSVASHKLFHRKLSVRYGSWYLGQLFVKFQRQLPLALAAYNGGPHNVQTWLRAKGRMPLDEFVEEIPISETRRYVKKTIGYIIHYGLQTGDPLDDLVKLEIDPKPLNNIDF